MPIRPVLPAGSGIWWIRERQYRLQGKEPENRFIIPGKVLSITCIPDILRLWNRINQKSENSLNSVKAVWKNTIGNSYVFLKRSNCIKPEVIGPNSKSGKRGAYFFNKVESLFEFNSLQFAAFFSLNWKSPGEYSPDSHWDQFPEWWGCFVLLTSDYCILTSYFCILYSDFWLLYSDFWLLTSDYCILTSYFWLLTTVFWLLTSDFWLLTSVFWLLTTVFWLLTSDFCILTSDYCILTSDFWLLTTVFWLLTTVFWLLTSVFWLLTTVFWLLTTVFWLLYSTVWIFTIIIKC